MFSSCMLHTQTARQNAKYCVFYFFHKKTGISHKATIIPLSKNYFLHVKLYFFFPGEVSVVFHVATIPMACYWVKKFC